MPADHTQLSTGLPGLDQVFQGLRPGDNVVFQVDSIHDYLPFVKPYCAWAKLHNKRLIYLRFAKHEPLVPENSHAEVHQIHPEEGFEKLPRRTQLKVGLTVKGAAVPAKAQAITLDALDGQSFESDAAGIFRGYPVATPEQSSAGVSGSARWTHFPS